jgi:hypothetical protein
MMHIEEMDGTSGEEAGTQRKAGRSDSAGAIIWLGYPGGKYKYF